ncbi:hypothetical protein SteCoe_37089 [Stentor coeruleus]|uniref:Uncharacterized protein n=1 Tax=Stentor coeruleus TaxID=5963 RepID=A0A1R2ANV4_9CILI|nr:hypothetical protein SteCoe_37089 [Stentor coeruleus]
MSSCRVVLEPSKNKEILNRFQNDRWRKENSSNDKKFIVLLECEKQTKPYNYKESYEALRDLKSLQNFDAAQNASQIYELNQKLKNMTLSALNLPFFRTKLYDSIERRLKLHEQCEEYTEKILTSATSQCYKFENEIQNYNEILSEFQQKSNTHNTIKSEIKTLQLQIEHEKRKNLLLKLKKIQSLKSANKHEIQLSEKSTEEMKWKHIFEDCEKKYTLSLEETNEKINQKIQDKERLIQKHDSLLGKKSELEERNQELKKIIEQTTEKSERLGENEEIIGEIIEKPESDEKEKEKILEILDDRIKDMENEINEVTEMQKKVITLQNTLKDSLSTLETEVFIKELQAFDSTLQSAAKTFNNNLIEIKNTATRSCAKTNEIISSIIKKTKKTTAKLTKHLEDCIFYSAKQSKNLLQELKSTEQVLETLPNPLF